MLLTNTSSHTSVRCQQLRISPGGSCSASGGFAWGEVAAGCLEDGGELRSIAVVGEDEQVVAGVQGGVAADGQQLLVADHEADPDVDRQVGQLLDGAAVGRGTGGDGEPVEALGFVAEPDAQRPRFGVYGAHRYPQDPGHRGHQAALNQDGEHHHDDDDPVQPGALRDVRGQQVTV